MQDEPTSGTDAPKPEPTVAGALQEAKEAFAAAGSVIGATVKKAVKKARRAVKKATKKASKKKAARKKARKVRRGARKAVRKVRRKVRRAGRKVRRVARRAGRAGRKAARGKKWLARGARAAFEPPGRGRDAPRFLSPPGQDRRLEPVAAGRHPPQHVRHRLERSRVGNEIGGVDRSLGDQPVGRAKARG